MYLGLDINLPDLGPAGVFTAYKKYLQIISVKEATGSIRTSTAWVQYLEKNQHELSSKWKPNYVDLINIFVSKSQFYEVWSTTLVNAVQFVDMFDWLTDSPTCLSNMKLWGEDKTAYTFTDLKEWVIRAKEKGLRKGIKKERSAASSKSHKKKKVESSAESSDGSSDSLSSEEDFSAVKKSKKGRGKEKEQGQKKGKGKEKVRQASSSDSNSNVKRRDKKKKDLK